ncbi:SPOR domain-containing protein [Sphingomonas changnyeongensis]|nr:SPOR domain-containing protein [Sphingomonas changnyeongensis]
MAHNSRFRHRISAFDGRAWPIAAALALAGPAGLAAAAIGAGQDAQPGAGPAGLSAVDPAQIMLWRRLAASGNAEAQYRLGDALRRGTGVAADAAEAERQFRAAAAQGHGPAGDELGLLLFATGRHHEAMDWLGRAAERGDPRARYIYATALFNGDYVARDWGRAYALMALAARDGLPAAQTSLAQMDRYIPADQRAAALRGAGLTGARPVPKSAPAPATARPSTATPRPAAPARPAPAQPAPAPPSPAPVPGTAPAAKAGGRYIVQLGAYAGRALAEAQWQIFTRRFPELASLKPVIGSAGALTRLRTGPFADRAAAERLCTRVTAARLPCLVLRD